MSAGKACKPRKQTCLNASDRRLQVQPRQEAKIAPGVPSFPDNFCVCRLCQRSDGRFGLNRSFKYMSPARPEGWPFVPPPIYDSGGTPVKRTCPAQRALSRFSRSRFPAPDKHPFGVFPSSWQRRYSCEKGHARRNAPSPASPCRTGIPSALFPRHDNAHACEKDVPGATHFLPLLRVGQTSLRRFSPTMTMRMPVKRTNSAQRAFSRHGSGGAPAKRARSM